MSIVNFADLLVQLTRLIDGEDVNVSEVSRHTLEQIIGLGEKRLYREVRSRWNEKSFSGVTVTNNLAPIPVDWEATSTINFGKRALLPVSEDWLRDYNVNGRGGDCVYFAEAGSSFMFGPAVANATTVQGRYFCRLPDLATDTFSANTLIANEPDLFLYGCLSQSAPFFGQDARIPMWEQRYMQIRDAINAAKNRAAYSAGRVQRMASAVVIR